MTSSKLLSLACLTLLATFGAACTTTPAATCTPINCTNGCCDSTGTCQVSQGTAACGVAANACVACDPGQVCGAGICMAPAVDAGTDAGTDPCASKTFDPALGTLQLDGGAHVVSSASLPSGVASVGVKGTQLYGVTLDYSVRALGNLPSLALGATLGRARNPADDASDAGVFLGSSVVVSGDQLLAGYTRADYSGALAIVELADAGTRWVEAPSNYTWAASSTGFLVNGATPTDAGLVNGIYALETVDGGSQGFVIAPFESTWKASSGYTAVTPAGIGLFGYFDGTSYQNVVRAVPAASLSAALAGRAALSLPTSSSEVARGTNLAQLTALGEAMIVVYGGYDTAPYTTGVARIPLTSGATVGTGAPVMLLTAPDRCTTVTFASSDGSRLLLGVSDRNGTRVVELAP